MIWNDYFTTIFNNDLTVAPVRLDVPYAYLIVELILYTTASSIRLLEGDLYALRQMLSEFIQFKYFIYTWLVWSRHGH